MSALTFNIKILLTITNSLHEFVKTAVNKCNQQIKDNIPFHDPFENLLDLFVCSSSDEVYLADVICSVYQTDHPHQYRNRHAFLHPENVNVI